MRKQPNMTKSKSDDVFVPIIKCRCLPMAITGSLPMVLKKGVEVAD